MNYHRFDSSLFRRILLVSRAGTANWACNRFIAQNEVEKKHPAADCQQIDNSPSTGQYARSGHPVQTLTVASRLTPVTSASRCWRPRRYTGPRTRFPRSRTRTRSVRPNSEDDMDAVLVRLFTLVAVAALLPAGP